MADTTLGTWEPNRQNSLSLRGLHSPEVNTQTRNMMCKQITSYMVAGGKCYEKQKDKAKYGKEESAGC